MERAPSPASILFAFLFFLIGRVTCSPESTLGLTSPPPPTDGLCAALVRPSGYPRSEHTHGRKTLGGNPGPLVFLQHGLFQGGDTWFMNLFERSLGFILADSGFDVWVGNVRGTRWIHGHTSLSVHEKAIIAASTCLAWTITWSLNLIHHPSSTKNLHHLFQSACFSVIRKGTFAKYDYGYWGNLKHYHSLHPPSFNPADIPESLPIWMAYGSNDVLADVTDVNRTITELKSKPELLYIDNYGHIDFILSVKAEDDVHGELIRFLKSWKLYSSY